MRNKILFIITIIFIIINFAIEGSSDTIFFSSPNMIRVKDTKNNTLENINLEDYIIGVVAAEMPASFNEEALKAQAIASRTYAMYKISQSNKEYDVVTTVSNQGYITIDEMKSKWNNDFNKYYEKIKNAVMDTKGKIMYYNGEIVEAYYFAMSNGFTEKSSLVFSEDKDYLQSVKSVYDNSSIKNFVVEKEINLNEVCNKLKIECNTFSVLNIDRSSTNRVNNITINNKKFKGTEIRKLLGLRSTDFEIEIKKDKVIFTTKGYGHGVGMSQYGANGMANHGYNYDEILKYYYKNVQILPISV